MLHLIVKELPIYKGNAAEKFNNGQYPAGVLYPCDSREPLREMDRLIHGENTHPIRPEDMILIKSMIGSDVKKMGGRIIPAHWEMIPHDEPGQKTIMEYLDIEFNINIDESFFSQQNMRRVR